jgi:hypothetical protein
MDEYFERGYRHGKKLGMIALLIAVIGIVVMSIFVPVDDDGSREISIAAQACWNQGQRAIMHRDGSIECRFTD